MALPPTLSIYMLNKYKWSIFKVSLFRILALNCHRNPHCFRYFGMLLKIVVLYQRHFLNIVLLAIYFCYEWSCYCNSKTCFLFFLFGSNDWVSKEMTKKEIHRSLISQILCINVKNCTLWELNVKKNSCFLFRRVLRKRIWYDKDKHLKDDKRNSNRNFRFMSYYRWFYYLSTGVVDVWFCLFADDENADETDGLSGKCKRRKKRKRNWFLDLFSCCVRGKRKKSYELVT